MNNYSTVQQKIIEFAKDYPVITGISFGCCPDESNLRVYYFLINGELLNRDRSDAISALEIALAKGKILQENFTFAEWPADRFNHRFLGKVIWRRS